jgi:hypothetical protein
MDVLLLIVWMEGVGSPNGIFYHHDWQNGTKTRMNCYFDSGVERCRQAEDSNDIFTNTNELSFSKSKSVKIFQNPSNRLINVVSDQNIAQIIIFYTTGNLDLLTSNRSDIDISKLNVGLKYIQVIFNDNSFVFKKFLKIKYLLFGLKLDYLFTYYFINSFK